MMRRSDLCYDPLITLKGNGEKKTEAAFEEIEQLLVEEFPTTAQRGASFSAAATNAFPPLMLKITLWKFFIHLWLFSRILQCNDNFSVCHLTKVTTVYKIEKTNYSYIF